MESLSNLKISSSLIRQTLIWFKLWLTQTLSNLIQDSVMRSPLSNLFKTQWWGHCCRWRKKPQKVRRCRCHQPIEPIKKVRQLGVWNPRKKTHSLFLCSYGSAVHNPVTDSVLEPDIDQRRADQEADLRGFEHGSVVGSSNDFGLGYDLGFICV